jgi:hypothetical protein
LTWLGADVKCSRELLVLRDLKLDEELPSEIVLVDPDAPGAAATSNGTLLTGVALPTLAISV